MMAAELIKPRPRRAADHVKASERLFVALDVPTVEEARAIVEALEGVVSHFKLGPWLWLARGFEKLIDDLIAQEKRIFLDTKGQDIPETMRAGAAQAAKRKISFLTIHGNGEVTPAAIHAAVMGKGSDLKLLMVTVLTSQDNSDLVATGYSTHTSPKNTSSLALERAVRALQAGCDGVIASGKEARIIKEEAAKQGHPDFLVVTPGVRPQGASSDDHKRSVTPTEAINAGADYLVVGRPIIKAQRPAAAAKAIIEEMQAAFDARAAFDAH